MESPMFISSPKQLRSMKVTGFFRVPDFPSAVQQSASRGDRYLIVAILAHVPRLEGHPLSLPQASLPTTSHEVLQSVQRAHQLF